MRIKYTAVLQIWNTDSEADKIGTTQEPIEVEVYAETPHVLMIAKAAGSAQ